MRNFFKERGRIREVVVKLPGKGKGSLAWTPLTVCSEVYKSAILDMVKDVANVTPSDTDTFLTQYNKAKKAMFYSLSKDQVDEMEKICKQWNRTGIPLKLKKKYIHIANSAQSSAQCSAGSSPARAGSSFTMSLWNAS